MSAAGGLAGRLKRMQERSEGAGPAKKRSAGPRSAPPGWRRIGEYIWRRLTSTEPTCPSELAPTPLTPDGASLGEMIFLDIETTGLSGGAGTLAFLVGIGEKKGTQFRVEQLFLSDYPGEPEFLTLLLERFREDAVYVSYNGKSFDTQILKSRFIMNGMHIHFERQLDLLHPSRRLWGSMLKSCSLGSIEEHILGVTRELDIPGIMVPDIYFDFLKDGDTGPLIPVFAHHLEDILSLERLLSHFNQALTRPLEALADPFYLGRWLLKTGFPGALELLNRALEQGNRRAGYTLGTHYRREGSAEGAAALWERMFVRWADRYSALQLAKYYEHRLRDYARAEQYVDHLLLTVATPDPFPTLEDENRLRHRLERIRRKAHHHLSADS